MADSAKEMEYGPDISAQSETVFDFLEWEFPTLFKVHKAFHYCFEKSSFVGVGFKVVERLNDRDTSPAAC